MGTVGGDIFSNSAEAEAYVALLLEERQKRDLKEFVSNFSTGNFKVSDVKDALDSVIYVLQQVQIPLSISFLNSTFASWGMKGMIDEKFLRDHQDKIAVTVIGNDLKIQLRNESVHPSSDESQHMFQLLQIVDKDINKLKTLERKLGEADITEISYDDFLSKFSSNKYKMNVSFIMRNSHALEIFSRGRKTYIRLVQKMGARDMTEKDVWEVLITKGLEHLLVMCLERLLTNFFKPINQGSLQACFNIGSLALDKSFLNRHRDLFEGHGADGVILIKNQSDEKETPSTSLVTSMKQEVKTAPEKPEDCEISRQPFTVGEMPLNKDSLFSSIQKALCQKQSVIILGDSQQDPYIADAVNTDPPLRLMALQRIKDSIEKQMTAISLGTK